MPVLTGTTKRPPVTVEQSIDDAACGLAFQRSLSLEPPPQLAVDALDGEQVLLAASGSHLRISFGGLVMDVREIEQWKPGADGTARRTEPHN